MDGVVARQQQIPFGDDNKRSKNNRNSKNKARTTVMVTVND